MRAAERQHFLFTYSKKNIASRFSVKHTDFILSLNTIYYCKLLVSVKTSEAILLPSASSDAQAKAICNLRQRVARRFL